ncbi:metal ABC transporter solute-binding protein, Zn/Mn family [Helicobacter sp. MIT 14-3879]|uniref:metal ABC transporter solute-binding protein, Zn/Mn family n=1 Tax=Helicobacter sp. MIT 14-3879 TaxID=2040649 RepID=UPI000E1E8A9E|nr:zinc ABC transporter substrate-binding protein [Helicobacter sp. MIT 14-3879]RDU64199.1 cation ABC transporter substrate-binding protein [Helicobacter sp. MIT 14-3879]
MRVFFIITLLFCATLYAKINVSVSIIPQAFFVKQIAGDLVDVNIMVDKGKSPETYEPSMKQLLELNKSSVYFNIGMPFEDAWLDRFKAVNKNMKIVPPLNEMESKKYFNHNHNNNHSHKHAPHIWLSFVLSKSHIKQIAETLINLDSNNKAIYEKNLNDFLEKIDKAFLDAKNKIKDKNKSFLVYHPAWNYIAEELGLIEYSIELDGKEAKISHTKDILDLIKKYNIKTIFVQPQFSQKSAIAIAKEAGIRIDVVDPLEYDWLNNINYFIDLLSKE